MTSLTQEMDQITRSTRVFARAKPEDKLLSENGGNALFVHPGVPKTGVFKVFNGTLFAKLCEVERGVKNTRVPVTFCL